MVPTRDHPDATRKTNLPRRAVGSPDYDPPLIPVPEGLDVANAQRLPEPKMKMIQISQLPFEKQNAIFELGTSMLIYAINMDVGDAAACRYRDRRYFGPPREKFLCNDQIVTEIANSCPLAYTCRRSRAAVYKTLHRLMQASGQGNIHDPNAGISILKYIHVTVRIGNLVAKESMKRESENPSEKQCWNPEGKRGGDYCNRPRCVGSIEGGLGRIVGLRSRWLYDNPLTAVTDVRTQCAEIPNYLMEYVDRIDTEWWFNRHRRSSNAHLASSVLHASVEMFHQARHITITPCMPLMSAAQLGKGKYWLRNQWTEPEEIAIAKLRQWKGYDGMLQILLDTRVRWMFVPTTFNFSELEMYVTESFPLPMFEIILTEEMER